MGDHIVNNIIARTVMTRNLVETWNEMPDARNETAGWALRGSVLCTDPYKRE